ncbi:hypothetical protein RRG08_046453 [Elysia crispata]|uniref:Uncharacterized protein n=1 Tax=Elysia crispata TaxID=231223 RepID=A0AAE0YIZ2_9GAST|nr:hypothetical protein RRG08_046453 [Elysia crispata]
MGCEQNPGVPHLLARWVCVCGGKGRSPPVATHPSPVSDLLARVSVSLPARHRLSPESITIFTRVYGYLSQSLSDSVQSKCSVTVFRASVQIEMKHESPGVDKQNSFLGNKTT